MDENLLQKKTIPELKQLAAVKGLTVKAGIRKADLIALIAGAEEPGTVIPEVKTAEDPEQEKPVRETTTYAQKENEPRRSLSTQQRMGARTQPVPVFRTNPVQNPIRQNRFAVEKQPRQDNQAVRRNTDNRSVIPGNGENLTNKQEAPLSLPRNGAGSRIESAQPRPERRAETGTQAGNEPPRMPDGGTGAGILEIHPDGYGFLRAENYLPGNHDVYVAAAQIRRFNLRTGDFVEGKTRGQQAENQSDGLIFINSVNGEAPDRARFRKPFDSLIPIYPDQRIRMERKDENDISLRLIDIVAPIGKGQRGMIVSPPKAGKTTLLKKIANAITANAPETHLIVLLIDERPEEVTDMKRSISGEVVYSTFDEAPENHTRVSEMVLERAQRLVEQGKDVVILLDSITRLARAYNLVIPPTGRSLSGGLDPGALYRPKRFFGAARNIENGGSLTIIATALVDTGSRMDDIIFEEFKGTGNMELHLDRSLSERRVFPAIDVFKSGTRREDLLLSKDELDGAYETRRMLSKGNPQETAEQMISFVLKTKDNAEYLQKVKGWMRANSKEGFKY